MGEEPATPPSSPAADRYGSADAGAASDSPVRARLEDQIAWYEDRSHRNRLRFKGLKVCEIAVAAAIPAAAAAATPVWILGCGGALIVALEGLELLQQYQQHWIAYRSTCERLKHERFLFLAESGAYAAAERPETLLAERVEALVSQEHATWASEAE
jgi:Protein of unknown function (DUF4231)